MKILFAVSLLAIGAAAVLAYMTRSTLVEARSVRDKNNREILKIHSGVEKVDNDTKTTWDTWASNQKSAKDVDLERKSLDRDTVAENKKLDGLNDDIKAIEIKRETMQKQIDLAIGKAGGKLDELAGRVKSLEGETDALTQELGNLTKELEVAKKSAGESDTESARRKAIQNAREKIITLTGRAATVLEVNTEFSFVLLNIGRSDGLTTDSKLMVRRDGVHIANLKIVALEANRTVADIELKTARAGYQVMPGDRVVIESSVQ
jgi:chromosome segregation ATPase